MDFAELIKTVGSIAGSVMSIITVTSFVLKPIRVRIINWVKKTIGVDNLIVSLNEITSIKNQVENIEDKLDQHLKSEEEKKLLDEKRDSNIREIKEDLKTHIEESNVEREINKEADIFNLKNYVLETHSRCMSKRCISSKRKETLLIGFDIYKKRNGNSFVGELVGELLELPTCDKE